ncbi:uncharacterized protein LACBIDRAFT_299218 [Laccaria bicolor S238N-H82]|uniref:Predicted protein n=1 Tax=Laccaria bicolor (strain S238N-H82 / ATCC MYA-4686) TaxID=486041 RepID=B0DEA6_LACBS|nr:uncharacterized protein LACBIDRAFT_299218 [Laccaria bicolor S238N-H82]EDR06897.1 predicted protein [Laccaria bicolor S238N-H82]|eukprot:XP_001882270.1 predicted protein [Laccaria bicolor S238N-H82]
MTEQITLYTAKICPWAQRVELALQEAKVEYTRYEIDLENKPTWYASKVNPASKVPALAYGGPKVSPDTPSEESVKLAESGVLLEFVADISGLLLPKDAVSRAKARFFIETATAKFSPAFYGAVARGESPEGILTVIETIQALLPAEGYAVGEYTIADAAITPLFARANVALKNDIGAYDAGEGVRVYNILQSDPKFARFRKYYDDVTARDTFKETFHEVSSFRRPMSSVVLTCLRRRSI